MAIQMVQADVLYRVQIDDVINKRNIVITHPQTDERYLLHLQSGCGELVEGQNVSLAIRGELNSNQDIIKVDVWHRCNIDQAERFTQKLYVDFVFNSNTEAKVTDESGQGYSIQYGESCRYISRYLENYIYVLQSSSGLRRGDRIYLPDKDGQCSIIQLSKKLDEPEIPEAANEQIPTTVTDVRALPGNGKVFLSWRAAQDNEGISHYLVSYNRYKLNTKDVPAQEMPNQIRTENTHLNVTNLNNDRPYYFYVLAVNTSGNASSNWSNGVSAMPKSSIFSGKAVPSGISPLNVRVASESSRSFVIRWDPVPNTTRHTVLLEIDGEREFAQANYIKRYIRILKRPHRKGKELTLKLWAYSLRGFIKKEEIDFEF